MKLTYDLVKEIESIYPKIIKKFGKSKHRGWTPKLVLIHDPSYSAYGEYYPGGKEIILNVAYCQNRRDLIGTLIHEYTHHLQPNDWSKEDDYWNNPYEDEANKNAQDWKKFK